MIEEDHVFWAKEVLRFLVGRVLNTAIADKTITYTDLATAINYPEPRTGNLFGSNIGNTLGKMGQLFGGLPIPDWKDRIPFIQALVVTKQTGLPGDGLKAFYPAYADLPEPKQRDYVAREELQILTFGNRWLKVLSLLGITPVDIDNSVALVAGSWYNPFGKDGSPEHRAIRDYIVKNPLSVKVHDAESGIPEFALKSADSVDVVFLGDKYIHAIEVKSRRSNNKDLERGVYQCIKYGEVLKAEEKAANRKGPVRFVRRVLVYEQTLPPGLIDLADLHSVVVIDNFKAHLAT